MTPTPTIALHWPRMVANRRAPSFWCRLSHEDWWAFAPDGTAVECQKCGAAWKGGRAAMSTEIITVPINVLVWQCVCLSCQSRIAVIHADQPRLRSNPFRFCCLCGSVATFYRVDEPAMDSQQ